MLRPGKEGEADQGRELVAERDERRAPKPERCIRRDPDAGEDGDYERADDERRFAQPLVGGVRRKRADCRGLTQAPIRPVAEPHSPDSSAPHRRKGRYLPRRGYAREQRAPAIEAPGGQRREE